MFVIWLAQTRMQFRSKKLFYRQFVSLIFWTVVFLARLYLVCLMLTILLCVETLLLSVLVVLISDCSWVLLLEGRLPKKQLPIFKSFRYY